MPKKKTKKQEFTLLRGRYYLLPERGWKVWQRAKESAPILVALDKNSGELKLFSEAYLAQLQNDGKTKKA